MKVKLLQSTPNPVEILIFTKRTRLTMSPSSWQEVIDMPEGQKQKELEYIFGTIGSSWEFVDYVFLLEGVTRAFTHQLVRHRVGVAFAQQSMRTVDVGDFEYLATDSCTDKTVYHYGMTVIKDCYQQCLKEGVRPQDARGLLPTNILTNIVMKINLRALSGLLNVRLCYKAQGEFQAVAREMRKAVLAEHSWADPVLQVCCVQHGYCPFSNFNECPIKKLLPNVNRNAIQKIWSEVNSEIKFIAR